MLEPESSCSVPLSVVNSLFTCSLCGGYWRQATTICECLHTFCKTCIYRYIQQQGRCPRCWCRMSRDKPWVYAYEDTRLQEILQAFLPQIQDDVEEFRAVALSILSVKGDTDRTQETAMVPAEGNLYFSPIPVYPGNPRDCCFLQLLPLQGSTQPPLRKPILRVPADITIAHLKQYLYLKLCHSGDSQIEVSYYVHGMPRPIFQYTKKVYSGYEILPHTLHIRSILRDNLSILSLFYA